ncbi:MAG: hypothetical protein DMG07_09460 [Acidobacteria bacterium]|nr:MAG: hypothetical protein DMG07_09460 [Acidobacteriota bacterium]
MDPSMKTYMSTPPAAPPAAAARSFLPEGLKTGLILALVAGGAYLVYDGYQFQHKTASDLTVISDKLKALENHTKAGEATMSSLKGEINQTQQASRQELRKTAAQIEAESHKTKTELSKALATKADSSQVQALRAAKSAASRPKSAPSRPTWPPRARTWRGRSASSST